MVSGLPFGELREITLLIPGEHFFCESISCSEDVEDQDLEELVYRVLENDEFPLIRSSNWHGIF